MWWPNAVALSRAELAELGRRLRAAGYKVETKDLSPFAINIVDHAAGADPDCRREVQAIVEALLAERRR